MLRGATNADYPALPGLWLSILGDPAAAGGPRGGHRVTLVRPVRRPAVGLGLTRRAEPAPTLAAPPARTASAGMAGSPAAGHAGRLHPADSRSCTGPAALVAARRAAGRARARRSRPSRDR